MTGVRAIECGSAISDQLDGLRATAAGWAAAPSARLVELVSAARSTTAAVAREWTEAAAKAKGITLGTPPVSEEWQSGPWALLHYLRTIEASLRDLARGDKPRIPGAVRRGPSGRVIVPTYPFDTWDRLLFPGVTAETWMQPGLGVADVRVRQAAAHDPERPPPPRAVLVLGAGNITSIAPMDALYKLLVERTVVMLKISPVVGYMSDVLGHALRPFIEAGALAIVEGGADLGRALVHDDRIDAVHITGSEETYRHIVFGTDQDGRPRKAGDGAVLAKPVTAELGNVTPAILVPGPWSDRDLSYQAENVAATVMHNAGFNCITSRLLIQESSWELRDALMQQIEAAMRATPVREPYYPGAQARHARFVTAHPDAQLIGASTGVPWTIIRDLDPEQSDEICFREEAFVALTGELAIPASDPVSFLDEAVRFCNERVLGTLGISIFIHPATMSHPDVAAGLERAIADLRYGTVAINAWSGFGYAMATTPWGAYPGHTPEDIQSGVGVVHNSLMLDGVEKTIVRSPWRTFPKPTWFPSHRSADDVLEATTFFEANPNPLAFARVLSRALRN